MTILKRLRSRPSTGERDVSSAQASELAIVEAHERTHQNRPAILTKLRWLRGSEPLTGYDALSAEQITRALPDADTRTLKARREDERTFRHRQMVLDDVARLLPTSPMRAGEGRAEEERAARIRDGGTSQEQTAGGLAHPSSAPDGPAARERADG